METGGSTPREVVLLSSQARNDTGGMPARANLAPRNATERDGGQARLVQSGRTFVLLRLRNGGPGGVDMEGGTKPGGSPVQIPAEHRMSRDFWREPLTLARSRSFSLCTRVAGYCSLYHAATFVKAM